jgi:hypothetical protein
VLILVWGLALEPPLAAVRAELEALGASVVFVDQHRVLETELELCVDDDVHGCLRTSDGSWDLRSIGGMYARPYDSRMLSSIAAAGPDSPAWQHAIAIDDALWAWAEVAPALVINRPSAIGTNASKPYQLGRIRDLGFRFPETLITTEPALAEEFWADHADVIYKSISSTRSIVGRIEFEHRQRLPDVRTCPTLFQRRVPGVDIRVHIVGAEIFSSEIISDAIDYRYAGDSDVVIRPITLPAAIEDRCRSAATALGLHVAGIDLRRTPDDEWYCFEVNPSPAFTFYEDATGQPIGAAIARLLMCGARARLD